LKTIGRGDLPADRFSRRIAVNSRTLSTLAVMGFILMGAIFVGLRHESRHRAQMAREESYWRLTYEVEFDALPVTSEEQVELRMPMPADTRYCQFLGYSATHPGLRPPALKTAAHGGNELVMTTQGTGRFYASANFTLRQRPSSDLGRQAPLEYLTPDDELRFLASTRMLPVDDAKVREVAQMLTSKGDTPEKRVRAIFNYCQAIPAGDVDSVPLVLTEKQANTKGRARTMVALCRAIGTPARLAMGFEIKQMRGRLAEVREGTDAASTGAEPHIWMEAFLGQTWVPFDPTYGFSYSTNFLPVRRGAEELITTNNVSRLQTAYSMARLDSVAQVLLTQERHPLQIFDLTRLPVPMHEVLKILLLLPFAALITACLRNVVGLGTFGTFSPALLAMSFIYSDVMTGLAILVIVVAAGLVGRKLLERLRLLMVPRLSIVLTMVILCVVFGVSALHFVLGPKISAHVVLLPMVILTMLIERFHVTAEEDGLSYTIHLALGTLVVAVLCYLVLMWEEVGATVLVYPEIHFFTIAAFIMLGRYAGYRLTELWRFRDLVREREWSR
jgi:transglutaminase-like putative cysteine protease